MPGGLLQLVAYGAQDAYISGNPQITFWKSLYKRHTNFAMEPFRINFNGQPSWSTKQTAIVGRHADLLFSTYVEVQMDHLEIGGATLNMWNDGVLSRSVPGIGGLGYNLIEYAELDVGGQIIDRQYGEFMYLWTSLTNDFVKSNLTSSMINGNLSPASAGSHPLTFSQPVGCSTGVGRPSLPNTLYIPLYFFFTRNPGAALPLISLQYHEVKINIQWNNPQLIAGNFTKVNLLPPPKQAALYIDYIYLDTEERRRMAQQSHEYLIEQTQYNENVGLSAPNNRIDLTFNHPVKELIWLVQPNAYRNCKAKTNTLGNRPATRLLPFTYDQHAVYEQWIQFNGQDRMDRRYGDYFNKVQPYQHHTGAMPGVGVYMYSFAVKPEEHQPSGSCNFSRIDTATIVMALDGSQTINQDQDRTFDVRVYAVNYNILRIMSGMGGLAYSN
jgi:hypothetical protein